MTVGRASALSAAALSVGSHWHSEAPLDLDLEDKLCVKVAGGGRSALSHALFLRIFLEGGL